MSNVDFLSMAAELKEVTTPTEMRAEIFRFQYHDPIVRAVMDTADYKGLNAEDRYTMLAYYALMEKIKTTNRLLEFARADTRPLIMTLDTDEARGGKGE